MDCFSIDGPVALSGSVAIAGSKNASLPILAASLLAGGNVELHRIPRLDDVRVMLRVLAELGAEIHGLDDGGVGIVTPDDGPFIVPTRLARAMRASFCVLGPLLARRGRAVVPLPGGCRIGPRPIDLHLAGLAALGADLSIDGDRVVGRAERLRGATLHLTGPRGSTVTGTANVMSAAVRAKGKTVILGAAREPEVVDLGQFLKSLGARIEGLGTDVIEIIGVEALGSTAHAVIADRIEAATFLVAGCISAATGQPGGKVRVTDVVPDDLQSVIAALSATGATIESGSDWVSVTPTGRPLATRLIARPFPHLPTDVQAQFTALLALATGHSTVTDEVFPERFGHVAQLRRFGAGIAVHGHSASIEGRHMLHAATVVASDLRATSALVLAALAAHGRSTIRRIDHLDRGYESLDDKLRSLGAKIQRFATDRVHPSLHALAAVG